jgi:hypothetical protein
VGVEPRHVGLGLLAVAGGDRGPALVVHVEHQLRRLLLRVAEQLLEDVDDVGHEVDRVVPDHDDPGAGDIGRLIDVGLDDRGGLKRSH